MESGRRDVAFRQLLERCWLLALERQHWATGVIGGRSWSTDLEERTISFTDGPSMEADLLGSAAPDEGIWLWAWANGSLNLPERCLDASRRASDAADRRGASELAAGRVPLSDIVDAHTVGAVGGDLLDADAYFVAPYGPYQTVLALRSPLLALPPLDGATLTRTVLLSGGLGAYGYDHRAMIAPYLERRDATVDGQGDRWSVALPSGEQVVVSFDDLGRCSEIERPHVMMSAGTIEVARRRAWRDAARAYRVVVDGEDLGAVKNGATVRLPVATGVHTLQMALNHATSPAITASVAEGATLRVECGPAGSARQAGRDYAENPATYISLTPHR